MKRIFQYVSVILLSVLLGCDDDEFEQPTDTPSNIHVTTGFGTGTPIVQINGFESFADLSIGVESREWTFPGGDITDMTSTNEDILQVTFFETGTYEVNLSLDFLEPPYDWRTQTFRSSDKIDTTLIVTVVDSVQAQFQAFYIAIDGSDSTALDMSSGALNQLMAGESIRLKQSSIGAPTVFEYTSLGARPEVTEVRNLPDSVVEIKYSRLGQYDLTFNPFRTKPQGSDEIVLTDFIEVIPSTRPILLEDIFRLSDNVIALQYSRTLDVPTGNEGNFNVRVENSFIDENGLPRVFDEIFPIVEARAGEDVNDNLLLLDFGQPIYSSDLITITYNGGNIQSADGITVAGFSDETLEWTFENLAAEYGGFEDETDWVFTPDLFSPEGDLGLTPPMLSPIQARSGSTSMRFESFGQDRDDPNRSVSEVNLLANRGDNPDWEGEDLRLTLRDGAIYRVRAWFYVDDFLLPSMVGDDFDLQEFSIFLWQKSDKVITFEVRQPSDNRASNAKEFWREGEWFEFEGEFTNVGDGFATIHMRSIGAFTLFVDDMVIEEIELRPAP
ncbi:MAG: hypothetical protein AAF519_00275 [Bacteroidota bacterium]